MGCCCTSNGAARGWAHKNRGGPSARRSYRTAPRTNWWRQASGGSGIRTREGVAPLHALQACPFVRSGKPPPEILRNRPEAPGRADRRPGGLMGGGLGGQGKPIVSGGGGVIRTREGRS